MKTPSAIVEEAMLLVVRQSFNCGNRLALLCTIWTVFDHKKEMDEKTPSRVVAETTKTSSNSSYGYQIKDKTKHPITK